MFTLKTTVIPAFLQGSEVPCVTKLSNSSLEASSTPGSTLFMKGWPICAFAVVTKRSVTTIRLYVSSQEDIKGGWGIPAILSLCLLEKPRSVSWVKGSSQHLLSPWGGRGYGLCHHVQYNTKAMNTTFDFLIVTLSLGSPQQVNLHIWCGRFLQIF